MLLENVKLFIEKIILEAQRRRFHYCAIRIFGPYRQHVYNILKLFKKEDLKRVDGTDIEKDVHVTIMFGITSANKRMILKTLSNRKKFNIKVDGLEVFENKEYDYDVVVIRVSGQDLMNLRKDMEKFPHITTHNEYKPHITLAYVKGGRGKYYKELIEKYLKKSSIEIDKIYFQTKSGRNIVFKMK